MKVFISGAMTGYPDFNREQFNRAEQALNMLGVEWVINPAKLGLEKETHERCMIETIRILTANTNGKPDIDLVVMLPGWIESEGAQVEYIVATACGIQVLDLQHECAS